jgi:NAD(P)H-flavin reductase
LHELKVGDKIGLRGPFGKGFPYEELKGRDILIVGSGVGLAPVRTMIVRIIENMKDFGKLVVIASAASYEGLVYKEDLKKWGEIDGIKVLYALSKPTDKADAM